MKTLYGKNVHVWFRDDDERQTNGVLIEYVDTRSGGYIILEKDDGRRFVYFGPFLTIAEMS